ncbi:MAG: tRNA (adenosine(37)-N6)-threonylcarbamoyltransferase complex ATPase subunit type 1 TsaE [Sphingomicrobium sp.]
MILSDEAATMALGARLASVVRAGDIITLSGPLGVGKTALARGLIAALGHVGEVPSPSFSFVQPYDDIDPPVWHVDLYRITERSEIAELGLDCADEALLVVEWPERADPRSWVDALRLALEFTAKGDRILTADAPPSWEGRWPLR